MPTKVFHCPIEPIVRLMWHPVQKRTPLCYSTSRRCLQRSSIVFMSGKFMQSGAPTGWNQWSRKPCNVFSFFHLSFLNPAKLLSTNLLTSMFHRHMFTKFIREVGALTSDETSFLNSRNVCCKGQCKCSNGKPPFNCFVRPCSHAKCSAATTCVDNYCGGCSAECVSKTGLSFQS